MLVWLMGFMSSLHHAVFRLSRPSPILSLVSTMNEARPCDVVSPHDHIRRSVSERLAFFTTNVTASTLVKATVTMALDEYLSRLRATPLRVTTDSDT